MAEETSLVLKMKTECERCHTATPADQPASICSFECTFCLECTTALSLTCPNCQGELLRRPRRVRSVAAVASAQIKRKLIDRGAK